MDASFKVEIASPCTARWDEMDGDERARFCKLCTKNVYDLSGLTRADAEALLQRTEGGVPPCVRFFQRADGTVLTADCPVGWRRRLRRRFVSAAGLVAGFFSLFGSGCASASSSSGPDRSPDGVGTPISAASAGAASTSAPTLIDRIADMIDDDDGVFVTMGEPMPMDPPMPTVPADQNVGKEADVGGTDAAKVATPKPKPAEGESAREKPVGPGQPVDANGFPVPRPSELN